MEISEHLRELKHRIFIVVFLFIVVFAVVYFNVDLALDTMLNLGKSIGYDLVYITPTEVLVQQINFACTLTIYCILPVTMYEIIMFIAPAMSESIVMRLRLLLYACFGLLLFEIGMLFAYKIMIPIVYKFLFDIGVSSGVKATISLEKYLSVFNMLIRCLGLVFEMPLVCITLAKFGILTADIMRRFRRLAIIIIFIVSAVITPPDVLSQCVVAIPMLGLYQISIFLVSRIKKGYDDNGRADNT